MLRSSDWNAHVHDVPPPQEDPPSDNPHPMYGEDYTAEQLFQQQLAGWLQQNQQFGGNNYVQNQGQHIQHLHLAQQNDMQIAPDPQQVVGNIEVDQAHMAHPNLIPTTMVQGVPFHAGFHPNSDGLADSPTQAYNDSISESGSDIMVQYMLSAPSEFYSANALLLARVSQAKTVISALFLPNVKTDNSFWFESPVVKFEAPHLYEFFGEALVFKQGRLTARKMAIQQTPLSVISESVEETPDSLEDSSALVTVGQKRKKTNAKMGGVAPDCSNQVRRSARCNKYNGFKPRIISDAKTMKSKVKPRKIPSISTTDMVEDNGTEEAPLADQQIVVSHVQVPPITPVPVMQSIGINLCGVPPEDLSPQKLLASLQEEEENI
jgi:hypothetical protein